MLSMDQPVSKYYFSLRQLGPFPDNGVLGLMYHKIGCPRVGHRLKGLFLYIDPHLFACQLAELHEAGFQSVMPDIAVQPGSERRVAITFDDGFENVFQNALGPLTRTGFCSINYLVYNLIGKTNEWEIPLGVRRERLMDHSQVREWLAAGQAIGAHTLTHPHLTRISKQQAREEITASKKRLEDEFGIPIEHFCYPYGDQNEEIRAMVAEAGYRSACTTKCGLNTAQTPQMGIRRFMVRYPKTELADWRFRPR